MRQTHQPITILIAALGGEGGGILCEWLVELARHAGFAAQATSIPGVAQRTGATSYYVEIDPYPYSAATGSMVMSLSPVPGCIDLFVASELLEAVRGVQNGYVSPKRTHVIASCHRTLTVAEKMQAGDGRYSDEKLLEVANTFSASLSVFDMEATAREAGTAPSAVMFGAIAASGVLPVPMALFETVVKESGRGANESLKGMALAVEYMKSPAALLPGKAPDGDIAAIARARVVAFQDAAYGELFDRRLARVRDIEARIDPERQHKGALSLEAARFLGLWMAFDDVIKVAALKRSMSRIERIRREVGALPDDLVTITDHLKPGVAELAGLLPPFLARPLLDWDASVRAAGREPLALPLKLRADTLLGQLAYRLLVSFRPFRPYGERYREEQTLIEGWLEAIAEAGKESWEKAFEITLCGRIIKGYGETNRRTKHKLKAIMSAASRLEVVDLRAMREAALASGD